MVQRQLPDRFRNVSDADWFRLLAASVTQPVVDGLEFPRFPPAALQLVVDLCESLGVPGHLSAIDHASQMPQAAVAVQRHP